MPAKAPAEARQPFGTEDWWAVAIGLLATVVAYALFASGGSIKWLAVAPAKWSCVGQIAGDLGKHARGYVALFIAFAAVFSVSIAALGLPIGQFLAGFLVVLNVSTATFAAGGWAQASSYNFESPLIALGLIVSNVFSLPAWLAPALRVEFYIKVGIVLLGATLPLTAIAWAGPVAIGQATIVSLVTFFVIYGVAHALAIDKRSAAVLGVGGAVCGVSAAIAIAGAVRARREQASVAITLVVIWAIVMVFALPAISRSSAATSGSASGPSCSRSSRPRAGSAIRQTGQMEEMPQSLEELERPMILMVSPST